MYTNTGPWSLSLRGTPCAVCGQPAQRLTVFALERVITHAQDDWPPCRMWNTRLSSTADQTKAQVQPRQAA
jgi:hypothetical protein